MNQQKIVVTIVVVLLFALSITNLIINIHQTKVNEAQQVQINKLVKQNKEFATRLDDYESTTLDILDLIDAQNDFICRYI